MMEVIDLLEGRERRTVSILAAVCGALFVLLLVFGVRAWVGAGRSATRRAAIEADWNAADRARNSAVSEWTRWAEAEADFGELRRTWFYDQSRGIQTMRSDLGEVLKKAGVATEEIVYGEVEVIKGRLRRVTVGFNWGGTYPALRRLLETLEAHPRALFISKIDFRIIVEGHVEAGITLDGYSVDE